MIKRTAWLDSRDENSMGCFNMSCVLNTRQIVKKGRKKKIKKWGGEVYIRSGLALALLPRDVPHQPTHPDIHNSHEKFQHVIELPRTLF